MGRGTGVAKLSETRAEPNLVFPSQMNFCDYELGGFFDEMFGEDGQPRSVVRHLARNLEVLPDAELINRQRSADRALVQMGITFNVYGESAGVEKTLPFDLVPRIISASEWSLIERGLKQRIQALNLFNSRFTIDAAEALATCVKKEAGDDPVNQIRRAFQFTISRDPNPGELAEAEPAVREHGLATLCRALFNSNEFLFMP